MIISIEGIDGAGKSTAAAFLADYITGAYGARCFVLNEFTWHEGARAEKKRLKELMAKGKSYVDAQLRIIDCVRRLAWLRAVEYLDENPENGVIIFDRYLHSTIAYQGYCQGAGLPACLATAPILPDHTIYLPVSVEVAEQRLLERRLEAACGAMVITTVPGERDRLQQHASGLLWAFRQLHVPVDFVTKDASPAALQTDIAKIANKLFTD